MDLAAIESLLEERAPKTPESGWADQLPNAVRGEVRLDEPLKRYTSIQIGGKADALVIPADLEDLKALLSFAEAKNVPCTVLGWGSNVLIRDGGIRGIVIRLQKTLSEWRVREYLLITTPTATTTTTLNGPTVSSSLAKQNTKSR